MQTKTETIPIRFGHSPDPDDAFMFYAIAKGGIPLDGFQIKHVVEDIESLNQRALKGELEATAVSVHAYAYLADRYAILRSGASVGDQYGPVIVSKSPLTPKQLRGKKIAIPGVLTTANLTLKLFCDDFAVRGFETQTISFDRILDAVQSGQVDAGVVIHEGQLTYADQKLYKVADLGEWWWEKTNRPLPLGVDVIRRDLGFAVMTRFAKVFHDSICYALAHREKALDYAIEFGRGIKRDLGDKFVGMYVNDETVEMSPKVEESIYLLLSQAAEKGILPRKIDPVFI